jgi:hypothetical protein
MAHIHNKKAHWAPWSAALARPGPAAFGRDGSLPGLPPPPADESSGLRTSTTMGMMLTPMKSAGFAVAVLFTVIGKDGLIVKRVAVVLLPKRVKAVVTLPTAPSGALTTHRELGL